MIGHPVLSWEGNLVGTHSPVSLVLVEPVVADKEAGDGPARLVVQVAHTNFEIPFAGAGVYLG